MMRINFILPTVGMSGGIRVLAIYAKALSERGHDVVLISPPRKPPSLRQKVSSLLKGRGWPRVTKHPSKSHLEGLNLDHRVLDSYRAPRDTEVPDGDVVVATWWETAEWVCALSNNKGAKVYFVQGHEIFDYLPVARCKATYRLPLKKIVIAKWLRDLMSSEYGDNSVELVYNGIDHQQFFAPVRTKQSVPKVGFLFHAAQMKGTDIALAVIERIRRVLPELRVIAFGTEMLPDSLLGVDWLSFHHLPEQHKIRDIYSACDVWLAASRSEGFNLPAMEAMACRTPVVSTKTGWTAEAVVDGYNGYLAEIDDVSQLEKGVRNVLSMSHAEWAKCSENAYLTVENMSWEKSCDQFEQVLIKLSSKKENT
jgi:glycosyltransferase involved in cell wall biosynthesis